jgi:flavin reductase (DIM6/NTAB) family NADH-FMN oxidoreductase RutF
MVDSAEMVRRAFGGFATGIAVVTTGGSRPYGVCATSFAAASMEPPLVLVCVRRDAVIHPRLTLGFFGVSVLAARQAKIARRFADPAFPPGPAQFEGVDCAPGPVTGIPLIGGALARFECELWNVRPAGDHSIFLGRLLSLAGLPVS